MKAEPISISVTSEETKNKSYIGCYDFYSVKVDLSGNKDALSRIEYVKGDFHRALNNEAKCIEGFRKHEFFMIGQMQIKVRKEEEVMPTLEKLISSIENKLDHLGIQFGLEIGFTHYEQKPMLN